MQGHIPCVRMRFTGQHLPLGLGLREITMKFTALFLVLVCQPLAFPQSTSPLPPINLVLEVSAKDDPSLRDEVQSYMGARFRSLGDVALKFEYPLVSVSIVILRVHADGEGSIGFAVSTVVTEYASAGELAVTGHYLEVTGRGTRALEELCAKLAASIDQSTFEPLRHPSAPVADYSSRDSSRGKRGK